MIAVLFEAEVYSGEPGALPGAGGRAEAAAEQH